MNRLILTIDQTPCRASYGVLGQEALRRDVAASQRRTVQENINRVVDRGNRLADITRESIPDLAGAEYPSQAPPDVVLVAVARPDIRVSEVTGPFINIFV